jgi:DNA (cytosine-5)-methyltransferase 1
MDFIILDMLENQIKILNLYACLGGNRYKWGDDHEITAVELDEELAKLYQERFPNDKVIVADAHQYLLDHYKEFDFIWSSPPCPTHSKIRITQKNQDFYMPKYPDMSLYQEIIFLNEHFKGKYVVENVIPYYPPLIPAKKRGRHLYWTNFNLPSNIDREEAKGIIGGQTNDELKKLCAFHKIDREFLNKYNGKQRKIKIIRNLVDYKVGKTILDVALNIYNNQNKTNQKQLWT